MKKIKTYSFIVFLMFNNFVIFSSLSKKEQRNEPGFYTLIQDDLFSKTFESGKNEYQKLFQIIENNKTEEDEDTIICKQSEITYVFNKQSNVITSLGFGIKIFLWPHGKIESFWY